MHIQMHIQIHDPTICCSLGADVCSGICGQVAGIMCRESRIQAA